jgi:hypothetical protein
MARKPGFLSDPNNQGNNLRNGTSKELTLALTPEALSLVSQPYYRVKVPVIMPMTEVPEGGLNVSVYANGHKGPGFSLGYNNTHHD